jgi:methanogenic corrinoid protein MtbC1
LEKVIGVLAQRVGDLWRAGEILAAHEHFASAAIRGFLGRNARPFAPGSNLPTLVVGTPSGQLHELGAVMVAAGANDLGWRVVYLGPSLPAGELAAAAAQNQARAVALSWCTRGRPPSCGRAQSLASIPAPGNSHPRGRTGRPGLRGGAE